MIWLLIGYMWLFIHRPFEVWRWLGELHVERAYMIVTLLFWICARKTWTPNRVHIAIAMLATTVVVATLFSPYTDLNNSSLQDWLKVLLFYVIVVTTVRDERQLRTLIIGFAAIIGLYELHSLREYLNGRGEYRMGTWRMIGVDTSLGDPNSFAATCNLAIPLLYPVLLLCKKRRDYLLVAAVFAMSCICILLTGSRSGFACLFLLLIGAGLVTRYRWRMVLALAVAAPTIWFCLSEKLQNRYLTLLDPSYGPQNAQASAESRSVFFGIALKIWKENPLLGIGPEGFLKVSGTGLQSHSLYGQTLAEFGTVGAIAVLSLILCYVMNFFDARRIYRKLIEPNNGAFCYRVVLATFIALLQLLFLGLAGHNLFRCTWLWYAAFAAIALKCLKTTRRTEAWESQEISHYEFDDQYAVGTAH